MQQETFKPSSLVVDIENILEMSQEDYALARRKGFGASDSSVILGVNPYKNVSQLIIEKRKDYVTDEERAIGQKDVVRKGRDLEPMIIEKATQALQLEEGSIIKPTEQYKHKDYEYLKINFDGVFLEDGIWVPLECKFVSTYGDKHYNKTYAVYREIGSLDNEPKTQPTTMLLTAQIEARAARCGIPAYYYTQVQQQLMGLPDATHGYLAALHDKDWELCIYKIPRDEEVINAIVIQGYSAWGRVIK